MNPSSPKDEALFNPGLTLTYDVEVDAVYIRAPGRTSERGIVKKTVEFEIKDDEGELLTTLYVDYDDQNQVYGVEVLNPGVTTLMQVLHFFKVQK